MHTVRFHGRRHSFLYVLPLSLSAALAGAQTSPAPPKIYAQNLVAETLSAHPELTGVELSAIPPGRSQCVTIASTETKGVGEKCDKDEFTAMKTNKPFVEKEKEGGKIVYDVTIPIHDAAGKIIATAGLDFKPEPGQTDEQITKGAVQVAKELESKLTSKAKLFEPVS
jgi:hypothetical protein